MAVESTDAPGQGGPSRRLRLGAAKAFLAMQVVGVALGRISGESFWAWAPHDSILDYRLEAWHRGGRVRDSELQARYGLAPRGRRYEPVADLQAVIRIREARGPGPSQCVILRYRLNGGAEDERRFPQGCEP